VAMNQITRAMALISTIGLVGCDEAQQQYDKVFYKGTHIGVQKCIERSQSDVVTEDTIKKLCINKHQKKMYVEMGGKAGYRNYSGKTSFSGNLINKSQDLIITSFKISVTHEDRDEIEPDTKKFEGLWIEPGKNYVFTIESNELKFTPEKSRFRDGDKHLFNWDIERTMAVRIKVD
jgi:hypothetical protein